MKKFRYLFVCLLAVFTGLYFVSCGSDDDDEIGGDPDSIVGTWVYSHDYSNSGYYEKWDEYIMFCENGTCYEFEVDGRDVDVEKMRYVYNKETGKLSIYEDQRYPYTYQILSVDAKSMTVRDNNSGSRTEVYKRVRSPYSVSQLEKFYNDYYDDSY